MAASRTISRILIANRGEIARRIIRACQSLGLESVAVYTDVDTDAPFVGEASLSHPLGEPTSYLSITKIIEAARATGADAVHPGYGFLSENAEFVDAVTAAGLVFIGPSAQSIRALGSKTNAKSLARRADVPISPTLVFSETSTDGRVRELQAFADQVGYPLIIKAAAGGGGRGMRILTPTSDAKGELESATREAEKAFRSGEVFVERFISPARHVEVQIVGDCDGRVVALGTRDCSLQRSNQKIIEEAPAINLKPDVEDALCQAACRLAKEAGYSNLGTVEFLYSPDGFFYFLEVNTRLQVEHPVTEMVTGLDLVRLQIEIARGRSLVECGVALPPRQQGHAFEARICAEEYTGQFVTGTGVITDLEIPLSSSLPGAVRADMGVEECSLVTHYYDSLLGKLIVHSHDRLAALGVLRDVLSRSRISGVPNNRSLLLHLARSEAFEHLTHSIQGTSALLPNRDEHLASLCEAHAIIAAIRAASPLSAWAKESPWTSAELVSPALSFPFTSATYSDVVTSSTTLLGGQVEVCVTAPLQQVYRLRVSRHEGGNSGVELWSICFDDVRTIEVSVSRDSKTTWVHLPSGSFHLTEVYRRAGARSASQEDGSTTLTSSIPGKVATIATKPGADVLAGDLLLVLDSMKMEHPMRAPINGSIQELHVGVGSIVQAGAPLVTIRR